MMTGSVPLAPAGRAMRTDTLLLGPTGRMRSSMSAGCLGTSVDCAFSSTCGASSGDIVYMGGPPASASESTNRCVLVSSRPSPVGRDDEVVGLRALMWSSFLLLQEETPPTAMHSSFPLD